ncbi:MAG: YlbF family regulator [Syntrophomonadaceae bacterium]|nr:YlbF family regulator [Syntrophomonadaceae bacterium]
MEKDAIISLAFALGGHISESEELKHFKTKRDVAMNDPVAFELIKKFEELRNKAVEQMQAGEELTEEQQNELHVLEDAMYANQVVMDMVNTQEKFNNMMSAIYYAIDQAVNGGSGCESGCDSCGGGCC